MSARWSDFDTLSPDTQCVLAGAIAEFVGRHPAATLAHDPLWLDALGADADKTRKMFVCLDEKQELVGYAAFLVHPSSLSFALGEMRLFNYRITRYTLTEQPLLRDDVPDPERLIVELMSTLRGAFEAAGIGFTLGVDTEGAFAKVLLGSSRIGRQYLVRPHGRRYVRRVIPLPGDFESYIGALGVKTRQNLRRQERRLKNYADAVRCEVYSRPEQVDDFLQNAARISGKTYQGRLLGLDLLNNESRQRVLTVAANQGWLRCYILFCNDTAAAFMLGYLYRSNYYSMEIGYDPAWARWAVGNVLHLQVIRDLLESGSRAKAFDFMHGDNENKQRLGGMPARTEQNYYLVPATPKWVLLMGVYRVPTVTIEAIGRGLDRLGMRSKLTRFIRRLATRS